MVLGMACGGGKTRTTATYLNKIIKKDKSKKHIIFTSGETYLRSQWLSDFKGWKEDKLINFSFKEVRSKKDLDTNANVLIILPQFFNGPKQSVNNKINIIKELNLGHIVVDEAHKRTFAATYTNTILKLPFEKELYLTGTPFKFHKKREEYEFFYASGWELMQRGIYGDVEIELASTDWKFTHSDLTKSCELSDKYVPEYKRTNTTLDEVLELLGKRLRSRFKNAKKYKAWWSCLELIKKELGKTLIIVSSVKIAEQVENFFKSKSISVLNSNYKTDGTSELIVKFKEDNDVKILITVGRANEGFNFPDLENLVDMRSSYRPDLVHQIMTRVFRKSDKVKKKLYIRVVNTHMLEDDLSVVSLALSLFHDDFYRTYDGGMKDMRGRRVPTIGTKGCQDETDKKTCENIKDKVGKTQAQRKRFVTDVEPLNVFEFLKVSLDKELSGYAFTNSSNLKKVFGSLTLIPKRSDEEVFDFLNSLNGLTYIQAYDKDNAMMRFIERRDDWQELKDKYFPNSQKFGRTEQDVIDFLEENKGKTIKEAKEIDSAMMTFIGKHYRDLRNKYLIGDFDRKTVSQVIGRTEQDVIDFLEDNKGKTLVEAKKIDSAMMTFIGKHYRDLRNKYLIGDFDRKTVSQVRGRTEQDVIDFLEENKGKTIKEAKEIDRNMMAFIYTNYRDLRKKYLIGDFDRKAAKSQVRCRTEQDVIDFLEENKGKTIKEAKEIDRKMMTFISRRDDWQELKDKYFPNSQKFYKYIAPNGTTYENSRLAGKEFNLNARAVRDLASKQKDGWSRV